MTLIITFISLLTILSSLLVMFFTVTPLTSWLVLILSLIGIFIIKKAVILDSIEDPENQNKQKKNSFGFLFGFLDSRRSLPRTLIRGGNDKYGYGLRVTGYAVSVTAVFLFYSRYRTFDPSPLVWNILPEWFLPSLLILLSSCMLLSWQKKGRKFSSEALSEEDSASGGRKDLWESEPSRPRILRDPSCRGENFPSLFVTLLFSLIFLVLPVLFPLGTDYDPFVHRAAEQTIVSQGFIHPRTFLYAGEYGLVSVLATITSLPVKAVNIYLLPILILLFLPWLLKKTFHSSLAPILLFLLPFSLLTTTVPQGLGIFFLLLLLLLFWRWKELKQNQNDGIKKFSYPPLSEQVPTSGVTNDLLGKRVGTVPTNGRNVSLAEENFSCPSKQQWVLYLTLSIASFLSHPFTGIAAFVFLGWNFVLKSKIQNPNFQINFNNQTQNSKRFGFWILNIIWDLPVLRRSRTSTSEDGVLWILSFKKIIITSFLIVCSLAIPTALYFNNYLSSQFSIQSITFNPNAIQTLKSIFDFGWVRYTDPLSTVHFIGKNYLLFFFLIVAFGIYRFIFNKQPTINNQQNNNVIAPVRNNFNKSESVEKQSLDVILDSIQEPENKNKQKINKKWSNETMKQLSYYVPYLFSSLSIAASSFLVLFFLKPNITSAEHTQLFTRIFSISLVFLWPLFLKGILFISQQTTKSKKQKALLDLKLKIENLKFIFFGDWPLVIVSFLLSILIISNVYLQFPHSDRFEAHKGYLISQDDLATVQEIERRAQKPYLVLANQTVGAAALDQFGFEQYVTEIIKTQKSQKQNNNVIAHVRRSFNEGGSGAKRSSTVIPDSIGNLKNKNIKQKESNQQSSNQAIKQYFYSIPVSSKAQQYYLEMLKDPSQELVDEIFQTYDIQELYLILNDYWKNSKIISKELTKISNKTISIGSNSIFQFLPTQ